MKQTPDSHSIHSEGSFGVKLEKIIDAAKAAGIGNTAIAAALSETWRNAMSAPQEENWQEWVRLLSNSSLPRDTDLLIAKIDVLLATERSKAFQEGKNAAVGHIHANWYETGERGKEWDRLMEEARSLPKSDIQE